MDSLTCLAEAINNNYQPFCLFADYEQKTLKKEYSCFQQICDFYKIPDQQRRVVQLAFLKDLGGSSLTDTSIEVKHHSDSNKQKPLSYVPFRNTHLISCAVSWAEIIQADSIFVGANELDAPGYPDCRPAYYDAFNQLINLGSNTPQLKIKTPIISLKKTEIIQKAIELEAPLGLSWSCYKKNEEPCGVCDSCYLREKGFQTLGIPDPVQKG